MELLRRADNLTGAYRVLDHNRPLEGKGLQHFYAPRLERAENLERAIAHYELALEVLTREAFLRYWEIAQRNYERALEARTAEEAQDHKEE